MSSLPQLKPHEAVLVLAASASFFAGALLGYRRAEGLSDQLYTAFFAGAGAAVVTTVVLYVAGAAVIAAMSLARSLRATA